MVEPNLRVDHGTRRSEADSAPRARYAADVLLIADSGADRERERGNGDGGEASGEALDMESVVRKLIELLREQQP